MSWTLIFLMYIDRERLRDNVSYNFKHKDSQNVGKKHLLNTHVCTHVILEQQDAVLHN